MPETYNPQERSFIKKPEAKVCPTCQQPIMPDVKPMSNHMNLYQSKVEGSKPAIYNSNENTIVVAGVTLYKVIDGVMYSEPKPAGNPIAKPVSNILPPSVPVVNVASNVVKPGIAGINNPIVVTGTPIAQSPASPAIAITPEPKVVVTPLTPQTP